MVNKILLHTLIYESGRFLKAEKQAGIASKILKNARYYVHFYGQLFLAKRIPHPDFVFKHIHFTLLKSEGQIEIDLKL